MPKYTFANKETGEEWDDWMTIASMEKYLEANPNIHTVIKPLGPKVRDNFVSGRSMSGIRTNDDFRGMLHNIKEANPGSTIEVN